jgi:hypothetical protein
MSVTIDGIEVSLSDYTDEQGLGHIQEVEATTGSETGESYPAEPLFPERFFRILHNIYSHIGTFKTNAESSASAAATSASNAATSETNAATSESNALSYKNAAEAAAVSVAAPLKLDATTDPTANHDGVDTAAIGIEFEKNSGWLNTNTSEFWRCLDNATGAAVWAKTTLTLDELGGMATQEANAVAVTGGTIAGVTHGAGTVLPDEVYQTPTTRLDAAHTFAAADANRMQILTGSTNRTWTIPPDASVSYAVDVEIPVFNKGTGVLTLTADTGVTVNGVSAGSITLTQNQGGVLKNFAANDWIYMGVGQEEWA